MNHDRLAERLTAIFLEELDEQLQNMSSDLLALESDAGAAEPLKSLFRGAHTLKGAARAAGVPEIERTCHGLEALLAKARAGNLALGAPEFALLFAAVDALEDAGERLRGEQSLKDAPVAELARSFDGSESRPPPGAAERISSGAASQGPAATPEPPLDAGAEPPAEDAAGPRNHRGQRVRVDTDRVDAVVSAAGELLVATDRAATQPGRIRELHQEAALAVFTWQRLLRRLRRSLPDAADPAAHELDESLKRLVDRSNQLAMKSDREARRVERLADGLGHHVRRLRMRPFEEACESLPRAVRDLAHAAGKKVRLEVTGSEVVADRAVLDAVRESLLHLVRNAIDHGIEPPQVRQERGKPEEGTVSVAAELRGDRLAVIVSDDGAGLDLASIREQLQRSGKTVPDEPEELALALFEPGLSTRTEATEISGRGVGLDAVRAAVEQVRGRVDVSWTAGEGARFTLLCPLTLASLRAVLVRIGDQVLALPTADVERLSLVRTDEVRRAEGRDVLIGPDGSIPLISLGSLLGPPLPALSVKPPTPVVRVRAGGRRLALAVDELLNEEVVIVRPLHPLPRKPDYIAGMALLGEGRAALVLDAAAVVRMGLSSGDRESVVRSAGGSTPARKRVLVADDSITTRTLEQSILEAAGYEVTTAADGAEAWRIVREQSFDVVVSDVEMPRMSGFDLCEAIRRSQQWAELPVVLVTALESEEDRARGLESGADAYIRKSSFDQQHLLDTLEQLVG